MHLELENKVGVIEDKVDGFHEDIDKITKRLDDSPMDQGSAYEIKQMVHRVAHLIARKQGLREPTREVWSHVWGDFNTHFGIPRYAVLPQRRVAEAVEFLGNWINGLKYQ